MTLVWKLLRRHISLPQLAGFFSANLFGLFVVLLGLQFYVDVAPLFGPDAEGVMKQDYLVVSKRITTLGSLRGTTSAFTPAEVADISAQSFCKSVGAFTASRYEVRASLGVSGVRALSTDLFFESVPSRFVDTDLSLWHFDLDAGVVPIVLPRSYLAIYNFGFAQSHSLPKISEGVAGLVDVDILMRGAGRAETVRGKVVGFSNRLNTILVPEDFIRWSNARFAPGADTAPTRLIVEVHNPTDASIAAYFDNHALDIADDKLDAGRVTYFLKVLTGGVMAVGLLISLLAFYILMLSVYLLVQKNADKLRNLLLIGYTPARVSRPYQVLIVGLNAAVLVLAFGLVHLVRGVYMDALWHMFPVLNDGPLWPVCLLGGLLFVAVSVQGVLIVRRKVMAIWANNE